MRDSGSNRLPHLFGFLLSTFSSLLLQARLRHAGSPEGSVVGSFEWLARMLPCGEYLWRTHSCWSRNILKWAAAL